MKLILGGVNGRYLREIVESAAEETERVDAAVAYATDMTLLFDWCLGKRIPLRFWGRFDEGVPVAVPILRKFLQVGSPNFQCRSLRKLHAKVIWWRGYGVYIGSANLTSSAWYNNVEAGIFFMESEIADTEYTVEIESLFRIADDHSAPLTRELVDAIEKRERAIQHRTRQDQPSANELLKNPNVPSWEGLSMVSRASASNAAKEKFLKEWNETLEIMRKLAARLSSDGNRPRWIGADVPSGAQADQFLHAHYYQRTFDGTKATYDMHFDRNKGNPELATHEAITWWRALPSAPTHEDRTLNEWAVELRQRLSDAGLRHATVEDVLGICSRVWAMRDYARRAANSSIGLPSGRSYTVEEKVEALGRFLFQARSTSGKSFAETLRYVLYGGPKSELPDRLWDARMNPELHIENLGISALGELVGWALPDEFPPRNGRTSKALRSLGYNVHIHV
jgi:hypothetical protein